ncbi:hypothetical protein CBR_g32366 [Chara braunii]|uniref:HAT C-terminal dimerisation domain-containing protein n=1 Tax=Chara braunii TaxID=69332 RepID=A0A388JYC6_CHABU|nr:hypothetical protein CBR_g32366 [Chara braunii]|eukprot:GBG62777.1 hypothetical protein CBR_g32366 [Chara braunii]
MPQVAGASSTGVLPPAVHGGNVMPVAAATRPSPAVFDALASVVASTTGGGTRPTTASLDRQTVSPSARGGVFDELCTRQFVDGSTWGSNLGTSAGLHPMFTNAATRASSPAGSTLASTRGTTAAHTSRWSPPRPPRLAAPLLATNSLPPSSQAAEDTPAPPLPLVFDFSPTPTTETAPAFTGVLGGDMDPPQRRRDIPLPHRGTPASPAGLFDGSECGLIARGRGTYKHQAVTSYYSYPREHAWHMTITWFIVQSGMPFNCVKLESFRRRFTTIIPPGVPGAPMPKPPTYHLVRTTLLDELDADVQRCVKPMLETSRQIGCTIMTDGWTNIDGQTLCNYLIGTTRISCHKCYAREEGCRSVGEGMVAEAEDHRYPAQRHHDILHGFHECERVRHGDIPKGRKRQTYPCVVHVMDPGLEDIGSIGWVASRIAQARLVTKFFKRHSHAREALEAKTKLKLLLPAETRFDTNMRDSDTRQISKVLCRYEIMIASCFAACGSLSTTKQDEILEVFDRRRTIFRTLAHIATMMLDPEFRDPTLADDDVMQEGLKTPWVQFGYPEGSPQHKEVLTAIDKFHAREKPFESATMDRAMMSYEHPSSFWESKLRRFPHTAYFAMRILRIWTTESPCERGWSHWSFIHSKTRNRLKVERVEKLVRCHYNLCLLDRPSLSDDAPYDRPDTFEKWYTIGSIWRTSCPPTSSSSRGAERDWQPHRRRCVWRGSAYATFLPWAPSAALSNRTRDDVDGCGLVAGAVGVRVMDEVGEGNVDGVPRSGYVLVVRILRAVIGRRSTVFVSLNNIGTREIFYIIAPLVTRRISSVPPHRQHGTTTAGQGTIVVMTTTTMMERTTGVAIDR